MFEVGSGPLILLLHGFPEFWYAWRHQLIWLAVAGYRVVAPDLRGYNKSSRPRAVRDYRVQLLVEDVVRLIQQLDEQRAVVVGHDWGGVIAWRLAALEPQLLQGLVVLNAPHPAVFHREILLRPTQILRYSYAMFFQLPWLPELILQAADFALLEQGWRRQPIRPDAFSDDDIYKYKTALRRSAGLTGPLNYYRAAMRWSGDLYREPQKVHVPTLVLWSEKDPYLSSRLANDLFEWVPQARVRRFPTASHWLQHDEPHEISVAIGEFAERWGSVL